MALKCALCDKSAIVICHHCSKPLCADHRKVVKNDWVFVEPQRGSSWDPLTIFNHAVARESRQEAAPPNTPEAPNVLEANHCSACKSNYHGIRFWLNRLLPNR
jgi:hypothetical protein